MFDHKSIETKYKNRYLKEKPFYCDVYDFSKPKYYILDMFPYPSGQGLHVGHPEGYTASDILARMKRMQGFNVLHPIGWDAFGLPAEQYAIKMNKNPLIFTDANIQNFKNQINMLGFSYDWDKEIKTCDPKYYKWTQWIFTKLYKENLAYNDYRDVNFCPALGTVLANEEVIDGKSERGGYDVIKKPMKQWILRITSYADKLLEDIDLLDWPKSTIEMQKNWIGKSIGVEIYFKVKDSDEIITVFTTRVDTLFGATYVVLAPENKLVNKLTTNDKKIEVENYINDVKNKSDIERTSTSKEKTGVFIGSYAINPLTNKEIPIYIGDYVLNSYGSGAVMAVPAHDERDYIFAKKHNLEMIKVIESDISKNAYVGDGIHINSSFANGLNINDSKKVITEYLEKHKLGKQKVNYKLRDWLFSRQRYWGEPIPIVYLNNDKIYCLKDNELPLTLPDLKEYKPSGTGESPLIHATNWLNTTINGVVGKRETNTMPQWAGSCWYYIRYLDPHNDKEIADKKLIDHWLPVDLYIGGAEHAVLHLLYARFWHKFLFDKQIVSCKEPFKKLFHQGIILGEDNEKMSKSRGNVINPDDIVEQYGADTLRLYEMFMGPLEASLPWSNSGLDGAHRFIDRVYRLYFENNYRSKFVKENNHSLDYIYNLTIKKVTNDFENLQFNTAISQMMIFINEVYKQDSIYEEYMKEFVKIFSCVCPFVGEELWSSFGYKSLITYEKWPSYDENKLVLNTKTIAVQVLGKFRGTIEINSNETEEEIKSKAMSLQAVIKQIQDKKIVKIIYIKDRIINIVVK